MYPMVNFRWNRKVLEMSDERIAIQFLGTNYTAFHESDHIQGNINLTVSDGKLWP